MSAGFQNARNFRRKPDLVLDIHGDIVAEDVIKAFIFEGEAGSVGLFLSDHAGQTTSLGQFARGLNIFRGEVDPRHRALPVRSDHPRRAADTAANIKHIHAVPDSSELHMILRRNNAARVQLVNGIEAFRSKAGRVDPAFFQIGEYTFQQPALGIMILDSFRDI